MTTPTPGSPLTPADDEIERCPICLKPFKADDLCATDITEGTCHAECLEGSPIVDADTGEETPDAKPFTFRYDSLPHVERPALPTPAVLDADKPEPLDGEAEPVAWRWRLKPETDWWVSFKPFSARLGEEHPLYARPSPPRTPTPSQPVTDARDAEIGRLRDVVPDLSAVIGWLANGCDTQHAVTELRILKARIDAALATPSESRFAENAKQTLQEGGER